MESLLDARDLDEIRTCGETRRYRSGDVVFAEGEEATAVYFIESGLVSIYLHEFTNRVEVGQRQPGSFFGEMAVLSQGRRTASVAALSDTTLVILDRDQFRQLMAGNQRVNEKINQVIIARTEELAFKENLLATTGVKGSQLQVSIKGDPTMRETVFDRERRESPMDKVLPLLAPRLQELLTDRCVSEISLHFNSGEIRLTSIFDPFNYEIHPANKLIDEGYLDRHFPRLVYDEKVRLVRHLYQTLADKLVSLPLPRHYRDGYVRRYEEWESLSVDEIKRVVGRIRTLRDIPNYYLRNMSVSITRDAVRMQFNCDGTHIVSTGEYEGFITNSLGVDLT